VLVLDCVIFCNTIVGVAVMDLALDQRHAPTNGRTTSRLLVTTTFGIEHEASIDVASSNCASII
jgi:hypothetical protein